VLRNRSSRYAARLTTFWAVVGSRGVSRADRGSARSAAKPNLAKLGLVLAHALIAGLAGPLETFFSQLSILSGRRHRFVPNRGTKEGACRAPSFYELSGQGFGGWGKPLSQARINLLRLSFQSSIGFGSVFVILWFKTAAGAISKVALRLVAIKGPNGEIWLSSRIWEERL
jgi:hypothetical protein